MKTIAIIQARSGSMRLPNKCMKDLCGHPVIDWVVHRVRKAKLVDRVVVAMPEIELGEGEHLGDGQYVYKNTSELNKYLEELRNCTSRNTDGDFGTFYGSEDDVLARYYHCAKHYDADYIVRICGESALIDWEMIEAVITNLWFDTNEHRLFNMPFIPTGPTVYTNFRPGRKIPRGLEVEGFSIKQLAYVNAYGGKNEREHVTTGMYAAWRGANVIRMEEDYSHLRWRLDYQEDLDMLHELCKYGDMDTPWLEFAKVCEEHPEIPKINEHRKIKEE